MDNIIEKIKNKYEMIDWTAKERVRLLKDLFNFSDDEIEELINNRPSLFTSLSGEIIDTVKVLASEFNFDPESIKNLATQSESFPFVTESVEDIKEKLELLESLGICKDDLSVNFEILKKNKEEIEIRTKLAFINQVPIESFIYDKHFVGSKIVWSRMQALKKGICWFDKVYSNYQFNKNSKYSIEQLANMFPLDDEAVKEIDKLYLEAKKKYHHWKPSYKAQVRYETDPENNFSPKNDKLQKQKTILNKVFNFTDNTIYPQENHLSAYETEQKLSEYFDAPVGEINTILKNNPEILNVNIARFKYLKNALQKDFNLTNQDIYEIFKVKPSIIQKSLDEFIAYKSFLRDYLLLDSQQIKYIFINQPTVLTMNPQLIVNNAQDLKNGLNISFKQATSGLLYSPEIFELPSNVILKNIETYTNLGVSKNDIFMHLAGLSVEPDQAEIKLILSRLNLRSDEDFLQQNYSIDADKVYAKTMFNFENDLYFPVYRSDKFFARTLKHFYKADGQSCFEEEGVINRLLEMYPLTKKEIEEVKKLYYSMNKENNNLEDQLSLGENE